MAKGAISPEQEQILAQFEPMLHAQGVKQEAQGIINGNIDTTKGVVAAKEAFKDSTIQETDSVNSHQLESEIQENFDVGRGGPE